MKEPGGWMLLIYFRQIFDDMIWVCSMGFNDILVEGFPILLHATEGRRQTLLDCE